LTYIVAELGANWRGDFEVLKRMCREAQLAHCDAVKFQALSQGLIDRHPEWDWYKSASITPDNIEFIHGIVTSMGLDFFVTPTYVECVKWIDPYVDKWKIRHADRDYKDLIKACIDTGKDIILSTDRPIEALKPFKQIKQVYCIPKYPTEYGELNFDMIKLLPGYSNHCLNPLACLKAVRHGAQYLEYHLTDDRYAFAIDNKVSLSYAEMAEVNWWIRQWELHKNVSG